MTAAEAYVGEHRARGARARTIFGREPAAWVGLIEAFLAFMVLFPVAQQLNLTQEWAVLVMAVVSAAAGGYTAWATRDTSLGWITGLAKGGIGLAAFYGLALTLEQQATLLAFLAVAVGFWQRTQTSPVAFPVDPSPPQVVNLTHTGSVPLVDSSGVTWSRH